jgi:hypothetical protein
MAQDAGWGVMVSHRSGETEDTFIGMNRRVSSASVVNDWMDRLLIACLCDKTLFSGPCCWLANWSDQDRCPMPLGAHCQVQPVASH